MANRQIKVWDPLVRIFHWSLVVLFLIIYITEDDFLGVHVVAGYLIVGLIALRLVWGLMGSRYARFSNFVKSPAEVKSYLGSVLLFRAKRYIGHNPAGGMMILALLLSISMTLLTGLLTYGATEFAGPLAGWAGGVSGNIADVYEELHEFFASFTLFLVVLHVAGVAVTSLLHRENLVRSMIDGYKQDEAPVPGTQPARSREVLQ